MKGGEGRNYRGEGEITIKREIWNYKEKRDEIGTMKEGGTDGTTEGRGLEKTNNTNEQFRPDTQNNKTNLSRMDK